MLRDDEQSQYEVAEPGSSTQDVFGVFESDRIHGQVDNTLRIGVQNSRPRDRVCELCEHGAIEQYLACSKHGGEVFCFRTRERDRPLRLRVPSEKASVIVEQGTATRVCGQPTRVYVHLQSACTVRRERELRVACLKVAQHTQSRTPALLAGVAEVASQLGDSVRNSGVHHGSHPHDAAHNGHVGSTVGLHVRVFRGPNSGAIGRK